MPIDPVWMNQGAVVSTALNTRREFIAPDSDSPLAIEGLMLEMLANLTRYSHDEYRHPPDWLLGIRDVLTEEFDRNHSLSYLAIQAGVHPVHLARTFRKFFRCTIGEFVRQRRISFASQLLLRSKASCSAVALASGFFDQSHFSRTFKRQAGLTPAQFRRLHMVHYESSHDVKQVQDKLDCKLYS